MIKPRAVIGYILNPVMKAWPRTYVDYYIIGISTGDDTYSLKFISLIYHSDL